MDRYVVVGTGQRPKDLPAGLGKAYSGAQHKALTQHAMVWLRRVLAKHSRIKLVCGGAQGWDTALFHAGVILRDYHGCDIHVVLATPDDWQSHCKGWPIAVYNTWWLALHAKANEYIQLPHKSGSFAARLNMRNGLMLDQIKGNGCVLAYHTGNKTVGSGTYNCMQEAKRKNIVVVNTFSS